MDITLQEVLHIVFTNPRIHSLIISGGTGVGKSTLLRQWLIKHNKCYRILPVYIQMAHLVPHIDIEKSIQKGKTVSTVSLLTNGPYCIVVDDIDRMADDVRHYLLSQARELDILVIGTVNHDEGNLRRDEWELIDLHVPLENPSLEKRVSVLQSASFDVEKKQLDTDLSYTMAMDVSYTANADISHVKNIDLPYEKRMEEVRSIRQSLDIERKLLCQRIDAIGISDAMLQLAIAYSQRAGCSGHQSEWLLMEVAKALAVISQSSYCKPQHIERASLYVLPHRMRQTTYSNDVSSSGPEKSPNSDNGHEKEAQQPPSVDTSVQQEGSSLYNQACREESELSETNETNQQHSVSMMEISEDSSGGELEHSPQASHQPRTELYETIAAIGHEWFSLTVSTSSVDHHYRKGDGRQWTTKTHGPRGRYVRVFKDKHALEDLALEATIRAAAPYQQLRKKQRNCSTAICIEPEDYRRKEREALSRGLYLFVVDASGSMAAKSRMEAVKGAIMSILKDAYIKRDAVGMIAFRKASAEVLLPFTSSVERAQRLLSQLPTGGRTPLAEGLRVAYDMCRRTLSKNPHERIQLIVITDGRATWGVTDTPLEEAKQWARCIGLLNVDSIILDTEQGRIRLGGAKEICKLMEGHYYAMDSLDTTHVLHVVRR